MDNSSILCEEENHAIQNIVLEISEVESKVHGHEDRTRSRLLESAHALRMCLPLTRRVDYKNSCGPPVMGPTSD